MAITREVLLPDISDIATARVIEILVSTGDLVAAQASILTLESDKATLEIPAPFTGIVREILIKLGDTVTTGTLLLRMTVETDAALPISTVTASTSLPHSAPIAESTPTPPSRLPPAPGQTRPPVAARPDDYQGTKPHASPAVRRFARELGVKLALVAGSGPKKRILQSDVQRFVQQKLASATPHDPAAAIQLPSPMEVDFSRFGPVTTRPLSRIRRLSATHLHRSWLTIPHVTQFDTADITDLEVFRQAQQADSQQVRLTLLSFVLKACASVLKALPIFNSTLAADGENLLVREYIHIGIAVETTAGLVVPVIRNVEQQNLLQLAQSVLDLSSKAKQGKLTPAELQGGCFSISNLGGIGGGHFTPIINAPEAAILGVSRAEMSPMWNGREFVPRLMLPLSLSYDHRSIDGADGARFVVLLCQLLGDIRRLLL